METNSNLDSRMGYQSGYVPPDGVKQRGSIEHVNGSLSNPHSTVPVMPFNHCTPAAKKSAFQSRSISHSSIGSALSSHQDNQSSINGIAASSWMENDSFNVLQHLHKHASIYGLEFSPLSITNSKNVESGGNSKETAVQGDNAQHLSPAFISWRKLHLSKAKLKATGNTSALLAGFAMVAMVEIQLNDNINSISNANSTCVNGALPTPLLMAFATCTTLLVAVHMLALLISTCILPNLEAVANLHNLSLVHESPHEKMHNYIEFAWACSTIFGILLFMIEVTILCWIQFYCLVKEAAYIATAILVPCVFLFVWFAVTFYRNLTTHTYETRKTGIKELEELKTVLEMQDDLTMRP